VLGIQAVLLQSSRLQLNVLHAMLPTRHYILRLHKARTKGIKANALEEVGLSLRNRQCIKDTA
jgi:hypothetical protein